MTGQSITIWDILEKKQKSEKITMLTAYDYPLGLLLDRAGIDIVLVGDSLANVVLGLESTRQVGMEEMIHHAKAVRRAVKNALLVGDMPFGSYKTEKIAVKNARRFVKEAGCRAVKMEWFPGCPKVTATIVKAGIPVMGHVGLTPQAAKTRKDLKVQGVNAASARKIIENAMALERAGCFSIVLECIPDKVASLISKKLTIPTIGIGAGVGCDGQVLVTHDILGLFDRFKPRFVKRYANLNDSILAAVIRYRDEVREKKFPNQDYRFTMKQKEADKLS